ncbi:heme oxygenase-like, multi-helical [Wolffia australiana]
MRFLSSTILQISIAREALRRPISRVRLRFCNWAPIRRSGSCSSSEMDEDGSVARKFWAKFQKEALLSAYTPFIVCLASGGLELDTFRHYIAQDVHFLKAFVQAYEIAEGCADDDDAAAIGKLKKGIQKELKMHDSIVEEWGVDVTKEITPNPATVKYTSFLLATASGIVEGGKGPAKIATPFEKTKIAAYTVGAMTPCMRLYAFLSKEIEKILGPDHGTHPYRKWIDNYAPVHFEAAVLQIEDLLDKLSISLTGEELEVTEKLYRQAIKLEIGFFNAQPVTQRAVVPLTRLLGEGEQRLILCSDFDLTCTVVDSSAILAEIAILSTQKTDGIDKNDPTVRNSSDLRSSWNALSRLYTEEYEQCIENILTQTEAKEFDYDGLRKALEQLSDFEKRANSRVCESGVLKGLNKDDIKLAGGRLILQDGCKTFFQNIVSKKEELNADIHLLSYCWCGDLIRSAFSSGGLDVLGIHANELQFDGSISTGEIVRKMESPLDKIGAFKEILQDSPKHLSVYIGDSVGDLLCLLEADVGIVVGSSASLRRVGSHFGVSFVPLLPGLVKKQKLLDEGSASPLWKGLSGVLYTVSSWAEIRTFVLGV